jgi:hypothetical protein
MTTSEMTVQSKMLHKTQSHFSPNVMSADVLNDSYMHIIFFLIKIQHSKEW